VNRWGGKMMVGRFLIAVGFTRFAELSPSTLALMANFLMFPLCIPQNNLQQCRGQRSRKPVNPTDWFGESWPLGLIAQFKMPRPFPFVEIGRESGSWSCESCRRKS